MRSQYLLLLPLSLASAHLIARTPTWPEDPTASPPAPTSPAQILQQCAACQVIGSALAICATLTPSFTALQPSAQAKCLCYSSTIWSPNIFDNAVQSCANYASTAAPPAYAALSNLEKFCGNVGDVDKPVTVFTLGGDGNGGASTSASNYVASMTSAGGANASPAMTGYGGAGATNTAGSGSGNSGAGSSGSSNNGANTSPTTSAGNGGQASVSPSKTVSETGMTITVGGSGSTNTGNANVARRVIPKNNIVWVGFAISLLFLFL